MLGLYARKASLRLAVVTVLALTAGACANKESSPEAALNGAGGKFAAATPGTQRDFTQNVGDLVYFSSDSVDLTPEAGQTLAKQAQWLQQYPQFTITIEGHADERGTREYNIALGAKRATAVRVAASKSFAPWVCSCSIRCAITSVSVSEVNSKPSAISSARSSA